MTLRVHLTAIEYDTQSVESPYYFAVTSTIESVIRDTRDMILRKHDTGQQHSFRPLTPGS